MKYELNAQEVTSIVQMLDIALKNTGLNGLEKILTLVEKFPQQPKETNEVELTEDQVNEIGEAFDIAVRNQGINAGFVVKELIAKLQNPIQEEKSEEE